MPAVGLGCIYSLSHRSLFLIFGSGRGGNRLDLQQGAHAIDQLLDVEGLGQEVVGACQPQLLDLVVLDHTADADDADFFHAGVGADPVAHFLTVNVGQHDVQHDQ